jgi:predicted PurR-regulated permease PerM
MRQNTIQTVFFFALLLGAFAAVALMFAPFFNVIALSAILALVFQPTFRALRDRVCFRRAAPAAALTLVVILALVAGPLTWIGARVLGESRDVYGALAGQGGASAFAETLEGWIESPVRAYAPDFELDLRAYASSVFRYLASHAGAALSGALSVVASAALTLIATFFLLKDGPALLAQMRRLSPLDDADDAALSGKIADAVTAVVRGVVLVGAIQGLLVGVGFAVFGVGNATLWGFLAAVLAMVPGLGTGVVSLPAVLYLAAAGKTGAAVGLAVWAFAVVGLVDNFLAPHFYSRGVRLHQLVVLFGVLGGIALFGPLGFVYGPVILALFHALVATYRERFPVGAR